MLKLYRGIISSEDKRGVNGNGASTGDGKEMCGVVALLSRQEICISMYHHNLMLTRYDISWDKENAQHIKLSQLRWGRSLRSKPYARYCCSELTKQPTGCLHFLFPQNMQIAKFYTKNIRLSQHYTFAKNKHKNN
ncbi:MAG: hypothetical protein ACLSGF_03625 [Alistipes onderdonkii]